MKRYFMAVAIAGALSISTFAGEIPTDGAPKAQSQQTIRVTLLGEIPSDGSAESLSDAALTAILTALGLASI